MSRCPHCRDHQASLGIVFAAGVLAGALLTAVGCAAAWPGLFA